MLVQAPIIVQSKVVLNISARFAFLINIIRSRYLLLLYRNPSQQNRNLTHINRQDHP